MDAEFGVRRSHMKMTDEILGRIMLNDFAERTIMADLRSGRAALDDRRPRWLKDRCAALLAASSLSLS